MNKKQQQTVFFFYKTYRTRCAAYFYFKQIFVDKLFEFHQFYIEFVYIGVDFVSFFLRLFQLVQRDVFFFFCVVQSVQISKTCLKKLFMCLCIVLTVSDRRIRRTWRSDAIAWSYNPFLGIWPLSPNRRNST